MKWQRLCKPLALNLEDAPESKVTYQLLRLAPTGPLRSLISSGGLKLTVASRASVRRTRQIGSQSLCLPVMLAYSDALRGRMDKRDE